MSELPVPARASMAGDGGSHASPAPAPDPTSHGGHGHGMADSDGRVGAGHDRHAGHSVAMFRERFWLSLALTVPVVIWSGDPQAWLRYAAPSFPGSAWIPAVFG